MGAHALVGSPFEHLSQDHIPKDHPLRVIKGMIVDPTLRDLSPPFDALYAPKGRIPISPEMLLRALLLQILCSMRGGHLLMELFDYDLLFRWFVGLNLDAEVRVPTTFAEKHDRLLEGDFTLAFFAAVVRQAHQRRLLSDEHVAFRMRHYIHV